MSTPSTFSSGLAGAAANYALDLQVSGSSWYGAVYVLAWVGESSATTVAHSSPMTMLVQVPANVASTLDG